MSAAMEISEHEVVAYMENHKELKDLLAIDDAQMDELKGRAQFFIDGGHDERALMMLDMLEELDRRDPTAGLLAVEILLQQGHSGQALERLRALRERFGQTPDILVGFAQLHLARGELAAVAEHLQRVLQPSEGSGNAQTSAEQRAQALAAIAHERWQA